MSRQSCHLRARSRNNARILSTSARTRGRFAGIRNRPAPPKSIRFRLGSFALLSARIRTLKMILD